MLRWSPHGNYPQIDKSVYIDSGTTISGNVIIGEKVFIGTGAVVRADEPGSSIIIQNDCNI